MLGSTVAVFVCLLLPVVVGGDGTLPALTYSCNPTGTITVDNPDPSKYTNAHAEVVDRSEVCSTLVLFFHSTIVISGCSISRNISLWFFDYPTMPSVLTDDFAYYVIRCQQIPATGIHRMVTDESWVTNLISTSIAPSVTPKVILTTQIEDIESGIERTSAIVGEPLLWEIEGPEHYLIKPLNCTAGSGSGAADTIVIVVNGCSQDTYLLSHFEQADQPHILQADLFAFRFAGSSNVLFLCDMLACHNRSSLCDINCPSDRKRRDGTEMQSFIHDGNYQDKDSFIFRRSVRVQRQADDNVDDSDNFIGQVSVGLKLSDPVGPAFELVSGAASIYRGVASVCVVTAAVLSTQLTTIDYGNY